MGATKKLNKSGGISDRCNNCKSNGVRERSQCSYIDRLRYTNMWNSTAFQRECNTVEWNVLDILNRRRDIQT